ncbi:hypothetical protein CYMTET_35138, partial [Cymbomonas tetramitiformis]
MGGGHLVYGQWVPKLDRWRAWQVGWRAPGETCPVGCWGNGECSGSNGGGIYCGSSTTVVMSGCEVASNLAVVGGGGIYVFSVNGPSEGKVVVTNASQLVDNHALQYFGGGALMDRHSRLIVDKDSLLARNRASFGGGLSALNLSSVHISQGAMLVNNSADNHGGAIHVTAGNVTLSSMTVYGSTAGYNGGGIYSVAAAVTAQKCAMLRNQAGAQGGGIYSVGGSSFVATEMHVEGNVAEDGGGIFLLESRFVAEGSYLARNMATRNGGSVSLNSSNVVQMHYCRILQSQAQFEGGGVHSSSESMLDVRDSAFEECAATAGGALALFGNISDTGNLTVYNTSFWGNTAGVGAGVFFKWPSVLMMPDLQNLSFSRNRRDIGVNIYWELDLLDTGALSTLHPPSCVNCTFDEGNPLFESTGITPTVFQGGQIVNSTTAKSGETITPPVVFAVLDYYGNIALPPGWGRSLAMAYTSDDSVLSGNTNEDNRGAILDGNQILNYTKAGAEYNDLIVIASPGEPVMVFFQSQVEGWGPAVLKVLINFCEPGEEYLEISNTCQACSEGKIKWDNSTNVCQVCQYDEGLVCNGQSDFTVKNGFWHSSPALNSICLASTTSSPETVTECVMQKTYECDLKSACTTDAGLRNNSGANFTLSAASLCSLGYRSDVVLCGACDKDYQRWGKECVECPKNSEVQMRAGLVVILLVIFGLIVTFTFRRSTSASSALKASLRGIKKSFKDERAQVMATMLSITLGHMQVLGQQNVIFRKDTLPEPYLSFLNFPSIFNLDLLSWMGYECFMDDGTGGTFYPTFLFYSFLPCIGIFP